MKMSGIQIPWESLEQAFMYGIIRNFPEIADIRKQKWGTTYRSRKIPGAEKLKSSDTIEIIVNRKGEVKYAFLESWAILEIPEDSKIAISYICVWKNQFVPMRHPVSRNNSWKIVERTRDQVANKL